MKTNLIGVCFVAVSLAICSQPVLAQTFTFNIEAPATNAFAGDSLPIQVSVAATYEVQSVTASVAGSTTNLLFSASGSVWTNTLSLAGVPPGQKTLTIVATDALSNSGQAQQFIIHDLPPALTIMEPRAGTVARPEFPINVSASADVSAEPVIRASYGTNLLATRTNTLTTVSSIPNADGQVVTVTFTATDSFGLTTNVYCSLYAFTSTNWVEVSRVDGPILDVTTNTRSFLKMAMP